MLFAGVRFSFVVGWLKVSLMQAGLAWFQDNPDLLRAQYPRSWKTWIRLLSPSAWRSTR